MTFLQVSAVDSARFGLDVFRGTLANVDAKALAQEIFARAVDVAIVRVPTAQSSRLQELTRHSLPLLHADTLVYYQAQLGSLALGPLRNQDLVFGHARAADREELRALIVETFSSYVSHYHANPLFAPQAILAGYLEWAESHLDAAAGRSLWVARRGGRLVAFAACQDHADSATGEGALYGVHPEHAGGGLYGDLIRHTMADFKARGFTQMKVSTQVGNFAVQKVWAREGFVMCEALDTFHINALLSAKHAIGARPAAPRAALLQTAASATKPVLSVVVPVYNSASTLPMLVERVQAVLSSVASEFELVLVNDGSRDASAAIIDALAQRHAFVRGIHLMRNYGQHNALLCGIRAARFPTIVTMDDDLQHPPEVIPELLAALRDDVDVVYGVPHIEQHGLMRDLASQITKLALQSAMGAENARHVSAFRVFRTQLRDAFASYRSPFASIDVMLTWGTRRFAHVHVPHAPRLAGVSNYSVRQLLIHAINMMTGFSVLPLQIASMIGFGFTLFGVGVLAFVLIRYFVLGSSIPGFPFLAAIIAIFAGAQLFALGVIGEYLARMHFRIMEKPTYVIRESTEQR